MLDKIKLLLGITDASKDNLLLLLIDQASEEAVAYTHRDEDELETVIIPMVSYKFQTLDAVGLQSENYSGVSFTYLTDYPDSLKRQLNKLRKVVMK